MTLPHNIVKPVEEAGTGDLSKTTMVSGGCNGGRPALVVKCGNGGRKIF